MNDSTRTRSIELRAKDGTEEGIVTGLVTTFDDPYPIPGAQGRSEIIQRGTFRTDRPIPMFWEHNWSAGPIGVSRSLTETSKGLEAEFELFMDDPRARAVWRTIRAGAATEFSIGFMVDEIVEERSGNKVTERIVRGDLLEASSVIRGANPSTELLATRAVPAVPAAGGVLDAAATAAPDPAMEEDKPTTGSLMSDLYELVADADELGLLDQLPNLLKQALAVIDSQKAAAAPPPPAAPAAAPAAVPAVPARTALPADLHPDVLRALLAADQTSGN